MLPELLAQIAPSEPIASVSAVGAYDTRDCSDAIAKRGAQPGARPHKNANLWARTSPDLANRNEAVRACQRFGWRIWKVWSGCHWRSLVQAKMHGFKCLGERFVARTFERQVVELPVRVALLNRLTQLGRPQPVPMAAVA
jgi:hypothetical protein